MILAWRALGIAGFLLATTVWILTAWRTTPHTLIVAVGLHIVLACGAGCAALFQLTTRRPTASTGSPADANRLLRWLLAANGLFAAAGLTLYMTFTIPDGALITAVAALAAFDCGIAYMTAVERARDHRARARSPATAHDGAAKPSATRPPGSTPSPRPAVSAGAVAEPVAARDAARPAPRVDDIKTIVTATLERRKSISAARLPPPDAAAVADSHLALGVSLAYLRDFARAKGASAALTTAQMVAHVRQLTEAARLSFAELHIASTASNGFPAVGRANVFVSHAQSCSFAKLLDALEAHVETHKLARDGVYFWLDVMCIRQHEVADDAMRIGEVINALGTVVMVLDPWNKPLCLERVWCLYEIAQTISQESRQCCARACGFVRTASASSDRLSDDATVRGSPVETASLERDFTVAGERSLGHGRAAAAARARSAAGATAPAVSLCAEVLPSCATAQAELDAKPGVRLFLTMSAVERLKLVHAARTSNFRLERVLMRFDCRTAGASIEADRQMILDYIARIYAVEPSPPSASARASAHVALADVCGRAHGPDRADAAARAQHGSLGLPPRFSLYASPGHAASAPALVGLARLDRAAPRAEPARPAELATPASDVTAGTPAAGQDGAPTRDAQAAAAERAYANFNDRVKLAIREAVAALSRIEPGDFDSLPPTYDAML